MKRQDRLRDTIRDWLNNILTKHGITPRKLATRSGVSPATVYRALDEGGDFVMSTTILAKIADQFGEAPPAGLVEAPAIARMPSGFGEDLAPYEAPLPELDAETPINRGRWRITSDVLWLEGYRPGDILEFDMTVTPRPGDIVVAQVYNMNAPGAQTVLRVYAPPYLVTRSLNTSIDQRPLLVDNERIMVRGTMTRMVRNRA